MGALTERNDLRERTWNLLSGISRSKRTPTRLRKASQGLPYYQFVDIEVVWPLDDQLSGSHPVLVRRLDQHWGRKLSSLRCTTGDFRRALKEGDKISLAHIWAEIYVLWLIEAMKALGRTPPECIERFRTLKHTPERIKVRVRIFSERPIEKQFVGLENRITGYLNTIFEGRRFYLKLRMDQFVAYRRTHATNGREIT